jgi:hypothetical protein
MKLHRHGEVVLKEARLPKRAKLVQQGRSLIIGHSESGHHHVLTLPTLEIKMFEFEGRTYLDVPLQAKLEHQKTVEKHETQVIAPGIYERTIKRAYNYAEKVMKQVID